MLLAYPLGGVGAAQEAVYPLLTNGPSANRLNLVVLAEGYTAAQSARFLSDAEQLVGALLAVEPYAEYRACFNAQAIFVPSAQSGSDHPSQNYYRDTYFNSTYESSGIGPLLTIPPNAVDADYSHGQGRIDELVARLAPQADLTLLLVNDLLYGGGGGRVLISSKSVMSPTIVVHEAGHTLAGLGDEYSTPYPGFPDVEEPNTTRETRRDQIKWRAWIAEDTPLPTPPTTEYADRVGLFEGAHYQSSGWFRPKADCAMRTLGSPFCEVCREAIVLALLERVSLWDATSPSGSSVTAAPGQAVAFSVTPLVFWSHRVEVQWYTNGVAVPDATNSLFALAAPPNGASPWIVTAKAHDPTDWVRNDPHQRRWRAVDWSFQAAARLRLELLPETGGSVGEFALAVLGTGSTRFALQRSTDLRNWETGETQRLSDGRFVYREARGALPGARFYRAMEVP